MADEQHQWLDRDAAERLLRGEPLEGIAPDARADADRLARTLAALAAQDPGARAGRPADGAARPGSGTAAEGLPGTPVRPVGLDPAGELPGEAAALAAFRAAGPRGPRARGARTAPYATAAHEAAANETVRLGLAADRPRPSRWGRPVRFGLAAALAACMIGGVAVAAGTGVLPSPFGAHHEPGPATSASPVATPEEPPASEPSDEADEPSGDMVPDERTTPEREPTRGPASSAPQRPEADGDPTGPTRRPDGDRPPRRDEAGRWYRKAVVACRAYRSGELQGEKRRRLEEAARGPARVAEFCGRVLGGPGGGGQGGGQGGGGQVGGGGHGGGHDGGHDGDGDGGGHGGNGAGGEGDGASGGDTGGPHGPPMTSPTLPSATPAASRGALPVLP
ncbi:hypothetical protein [Streptomyces sp. NPDC047123]|uniref:hypothetical protein n=1 Tax=Streptomyces sp. NPDC047123 TaxID=3155622 RepID=UPI003402463B